MMRLLYQLSLGILLLVNTLEATAQVVVITNSSETGVDLEDTWLFRAGDSTGWNTPRYNDRHWAKIKPDVDLNDNPTLWKSGRGWFRQRFRFRRLRDKDVTISIRQFGRSEVYLDGKRIALIKPPLYDSSGGSQRIAALLPIRIADTNQHVLAVRYAFRRDPLIGKVISKDPFRLDFKGSDRAMMEILDDQERSSGLAYPFVGIFGLLSLLHFLFYRANPTQRVNRVLAATMLAFALSFLLDQFDNLTGTLTMDSLRGALAQISVNAAFILLLLSVYTYLGRRPGWIFWGIVVLFTGVTIFNIFIDHAPAALIGTPFVLVLIEYIRVSWLAKRRNPNPNARLPWNSLKVTFFALLITILMVILAAVLSYAFKLGNDMDLIAIPLILLSFVMLLSVPLGLSLSLVRDYGQTYLSLRQKFDEVEQLSARTLLQEQEKQQLLARQNEMLEHQVAERTAALNQSLTELRTTQAQLIQSEKLASLGELTAGIAHEIQNPLNFVNNFSEVSSELVAELEEELQKSDRDPELEAELLGDLTQNLQKITQHGHRASSIVKGMLEHSRASTGERQLTDINQLADEYLKLAFHGLRAKDKSFNCALDTHFAQNLPKISVVSQDIGRVLLNLYNNGFYATQQRSKQGEAGYQPTITVSTRFLNSNSPNSPERAKSLARPNGLGTNGTDGIGNGIIEIRVRDNGAGMPDAVRQKIFQPFFTTKPTGEGTGLGLSLSYDIITKGHGGAISVESMEGERTEFVIELPA